MERQAARMSSPDQDELYLKNVSMHTIVSSRFAVLDTNVVLDWLVFRHPICEQLPAVLYRRQLRWLATFEMQAEMAHVLARGLGPRWKIDDTWRDAWSLHAHLVKPEAAPLYLPRCSDPDDQKFIELAVWSSARWLLTRDRALLKLARRLQRHGVAVLTPEKFMALDDAACSAAPAQ